MDTGLGKWSQCLKYYFNNNTTYPKLPLFSTLNYKICYEKGMPLLSLVSSAIVLLCYMYCGLLGHCMQQSEDLAQSFSSLLSHQSVSRLRSVNMVG